MGGVPRDRVTEGEEATGGQVRFKTRDRDVVAIKRQLEIWDSDTRPTPGCTRTVPPFLVFFPNSSRVSYRSVLWGRHFVVSSDCTSATQPASVQHSSVLRLIWKAG